MKIKKSAINRLVLFAIIFFSFIEYTNAVPVKKFADDTIATSTRHQAISFIDSIKTLAASKHWPNIKPGAFLQNIKLNIQQPISIYPGNGTNFCGYGALTYLFLKDDPLGYAKLLVQLFADGKALKAKHPAITGNELKLCAYLRMNLSTKEIAQLMNISVRGVEISRYRLRKKLNLTSETNLFNYLISLNKTA